MRWSQLHIPTLRADPADADAASHRLLLRAGFIRQLMAGHYSLLPLGVRVRAKVMNVIREEMNRIVHDIVAARNDTVQGVVKRFEEARIPLGVIDIPDAAQRNIAVSASEDSSFKLAWMFCASRPTRSACAVST